MTGDEPAGTIRFRPFRPADLEELVRLDRRCFSPEIAYDRMEMIWHLTGPRRFCLLAVPRAGGPPPLFGFVIAVAGSGSRSGEIVTIDIDPGHRRLGLGRLLLEAAEAWLATCRNRRVRLQVAVDNNGALRFYERMGYAPDRSLPAYYPDGTDALEMVKRLRP
jgi:ribosomal protein S18 acetylase RimI-like enzyme